MVIQGDRCLHWNIYRTLIHFETHFEIYQKTMYTYFRGKLRNSNTIYGILYLSNNIQLNIYDYTDITVNFQNNFMADKTRCSRAFTGCKLLSQLLISMTFGNSNVLKSQSLRYITTLATSDRGHATNSYDTRYNVAKRYFSDC